MLTNQKPSSLSNERRILLHKNPTFHYSAYPTRIAEWSGADYEKRSAGCLFFLWNGVLFCGTANIFQLPIYPPTIFYLVARKQ